MEAIAKKGLNSNQLKLIAIIAMTVDHLTWVIWPGYQTGWPQLALHCVGRITAPIMWFFIAEGYHYTHSFKKYALRLLLFAVISHFAYIFASNDFADWHILPIPSPLAYPLFPLLRPPLTRPA